MPPHPRGGRRRAPSEGYDGSIRAPDPCVTCAQERRSRLTGRACGAGFR
jgi:hypothetical protein